MFILFYNLLFYYNTLSYKEVHNWWKMSIVLKGTVNINVVEFGEHQKNEKNTFTSFRCEFIKFRYE